MFCRNCGHSYNEGDRICSSCGKSVEIAESYNIKNAAPKTVTLTLKCFYSNLTIFILALSLCILMTTGVFVFNILVTIGMFVLAVIAFVEGIIDAKKSTANLFFGIGNFVLVSLLFVMTLVLA